MVSAQAQQQLYTHSAEPKAVKQRKAKYREDEEATMGTANIMFDKRVVRGNTYAARILPADAVVAVEKRNTSPVKKTTVRQPPPKTPEAVDGRRHMDIQTDKYLEELTDVVPEADNTTQTDAFLDRPPTPLFVPQKTGLDATTQIEQGDLFDFDFEVEPLLEVLVGKVLEQALMEVLEEEELAAMKSHQEHFEQIRNAELVATQRMEAAEKRKLEEKERRLAQERERVERERVVRQKVAASTFARGYLGGIVTTVFDKLQSAGYFYDPVEKEVEEDFLPWLKEQAVLYVQQDMVAREVVQKLVEDACALLEAERAAAVERAAAERSAAAEYAAKVAAAKAAAESADLQAVRGRATFILSELKPAVVTAEQADTTRTELQAAAEAEAAAAYEAAKAAASESARAEAEQKLADQNARREELIAKHAEEQAAAAEGVEEGEEPPVIDPPVFDEEPVDVEAIVNAAVEAVVKPPVKEITDGDVLSALLDKAVITRDGIVQALAVNSMGSRAYINHPAYA